MIFDLIHSIQEVDASTWDTLWRSSHKHSALEYPFVQHAFFSALEKSGATTQETGWEPHHFIVTEDEALIAAAPVFLKQHSSGEYVFDGNWADAYTQYELHYYPKLVNAIPFTPTTGPRIAISTDLSPDQRESVFNLIIKQINALLIEKQYSSFHCLFPEKECQSLLDQTNKIKRIACQFHWYNNHFNDFDDFLATLKSRKRKAIRKERSALSEQGIYYRTRFAYECGESDISRFYKLYQNTYLKLSGHKGYLSQEFFQLIFKDLAQSIVIISAHKDEQDFFAAALFFVDKETLYGRYWGTLEEIHGLHFEVCYYQGIEFAIKYNLKRFDSGAQGEHKIQRGFYPVKTCSYHCISHPDFNLAINNFVQEESKYIDAYINAAQQHLPFNKDVKLIDPNSLIT